MKGVPKEKMLRWLSQGLVVLLVIVGGYAAMLFMKVDELESANAAVRKDSQASAASLKGVQDAMAAAGAKLAALEKKQREADSLKALLGSVEPQITAGLEAAGKAGKPEARAAALTGLGLVGQIAHGADNAAALAVLDRAIALDKTNCAAGLAINLGGAQKIDVTADCQTLLAGTAAPAVVAKPATPAPDAAKAAPAADKK